MEESYQYNNVPFIIKRNPRQEIKEEWLESVRDCCMTMQKPRDEKTVYVGQTFRDVTYTLSDKTEKTVDIRTIYEIVERAIDKYGQLLLVPDIELCTYWTYLPYRIRKSSIFIMPMEKVSSIIARSRRIWMLKNCHPGNLTLKSGA